MEVMHENKYALLSHARDPRFLTLRSLQTFQGRSRTGLFIIEGIRHLARAVENQSPIESVFLDTSVLSNPFGRKLARRLRKHGVPGIRLSSQLYRDLTLAAEPQGIGAILRQQWSPLSNVRGTEFSVVGNRIDRIARQSRNHDSNCRGGGRDWGFHPQFGLRPLRSRRGESNDGLTVLADVD